MRLPSLPLYIDEFPALRTREWHSRPVVHLFMLSHFHTDHMKGLHSTWDTGVILTSTITKQLLLSKYHGLRGRVFALPFWCRTPLLTAALVVNACDDNTVSGGVSTSTSSIVYVTPLPAFHIPGSAMFYFEMPSGVTYLYTGDFKFTEETAGALASSSSSLLRSFLESHRVDHLYIDDTWLHLGHVEVSRCPTWESARSARRSITPEDCGSDDNIASHDCSGMRVLSKLLNKEQVAEAMEAIGRRMDHQRQGFDAWRRARAAEKATGTCAETVVDVTDSQSADVSGRKPHDDLGNRQAFVVRVYVQNEFGKELLIQQLAERLHTRAVIDDVRYTQLLAVVEALEEEREDLQSFHCIEHANLESQTSVFAESSRTASAELCNPPPLSCEEQAWRSSGGEAAEYPYNLKYFMSASQAATLKSSLAKSVTTSGCANEIPCHVEEELPLIEVVSTRDDIAPEALQQASAAHGGTPYYGVVISGWARMQSRFSNPTASFTSLCCSGGQVWHIPTTLHNTPQELINFVALLRPLSITTLRHRSSRAAVVMQRLGLYLRTPFVNVQHTELDYLMSTSVDDKNGHVIYSAPCWQLCLPPHIVCQNRADAAAAGTSTTAKDLDGLDALTEPLRPGYRIRPPSETGVLDDLPDAVISNSHASLSRLDLITRSQEFSTCNKVTTRKEDEFNGAVAAASSALSSTPEPLPEKQLCNPTLMSENAQEVRRKRDRIEDGEDGLSRGLACQHHNGAISLSDIADNLV